LGVRTPLLPSIAAGRVAAMRWIIVVAVLILAGIGVYLLVGRDSKSEKAMAQVCDARSDIAKQVDGLKGLTLSSATTSQVSDSLQAIRSDLSTIASARADLADDNREQVQAANTAFVNTVRETVATVARTVSVEDAVTQLQSAVSKLAASYQDTYGKIDCG
jgi:uncharacterized protein YgfB (UPF0149 family)